MHDAQPLQIPQALLACRHLPLDRGIETAMFVPQAAERLNDRHVAYDVKHLAIDGSSLIGKFMVIPVFTDHGFWVAIIAYVILAIGNLFRGV